MALVTLHRLGRHERPDGIEVSCGIIDVPVGGKKFRLMVDCGLSPQKHGPKAWGSPDFGPLADGIKIDAVLITHMHGDHVGFLPAVLPYLKRTAKVWMSWTSASLAKMVLEDSVKIHEREKTRGPYSRAQFDEALTRVKSVDRAGPREILPGLHVLFHPAGHVPGACSYTLRVGKTHIHYSGDRCEHDQPGIRGAQPLPAAWSSNIVIAGGDCTYALDAKSAKRRWMDEMDRLEADLRVVLDRGGNACYPAFGFLRGTVVAHELVRRGIGKEAKIYLDGACRKFSRSMESTGTHWCDLDTPVDLDGVEDVEDNVDRAAIARSKRPYVVITPPGMGGPGGVLTFWREHFLPNANNLFAFTGFVAPDTDGALILDAVRTRVDTGRNANVKLHIRPERAAPFTQTLEVACQVEQYRLGGHQSAQETLDWYRDLKPIAAVLNHGSPAALAALEAALGSDIDGPVWRADVSPRVEVDV